MTYHHSMETVQVDNYHIELIEKIFEKAGVEFDPKFLEPPLVVFNDPQVVVYHSYKSGAGGADVFSIVAFYVPHDGQCTVVINHMDGMASLDNADLMFPPKAE